MKKNNKGFTLIELLAVIIILAIIALIAVPTIMGIIESSRKSAAVDSAYGAISAAELWYTETLLEKNGSIAMAADKDKFEVKCEATGVCTVSGFAEGEVDTEKAKLKIKGDAPTGGKMTIDPTAGGEAKIGVGDLKINGYTCNYELDNSNTIECSK